MTNEDAINYNKNLMEYMRISDRESNYKFLEENYIALDMAIKALEQEPSEDMTIAYLMGYYADKEPCDDAISRQAVLKAVDFYDGLNHQHFTVENLREDIERLPSVRPQEPKWIPVSESMPEDGTYLVTVERMCGTPSVNIRSFAKNLYSVDEYDFHNKKGKSGWYDYDSEYGYWEDTKVIAWMPLPKPYEPQESESDA